MIRSTNWRQGNVCELPEVVDGSNIAVVISHDCDLRNDKEPNVELIRGCYIEKPIADFQYAKNARKLHISIQNEIGDERWIELEQKNKLSIPFGELVEKNEAEQWTVESYKGELLKWLAARYARPAFPDEFETHLRIKDKKKRSVEQRLGEIIDSFAESIYAVFFQLLERNQELFDEPYTLNIRIVYCTERFHTDRPKCEDAATKIKLLFEEVFGIEDKAVKICLESCEAVADSEIRLDFIRKSDQWRVEHLSFRDSNEDFLEPGKI